MSEELGDPDAKLVFLFKTSRCGSTLLTQMLEETGECMPISESYVDMFITAKFRRNGDTPEIREMMRDAYRWVCRPYSYIKPKLYFVKISAPSALVVPVLKEVFPKSKFMFMYRNPVSVARSLHKISMQFPMFMLGYALGQYSEKFVEVLSNRMGYPGKDLKIKFGDHYTLGIHLICIVTKTYLDQLEEGKIDVAAVRYEDIISDPSYAMRQILNFVGLPESTLQRALQGLQKDSQRNSMLSRKALSGYVDVPMTVNSRELANKLLQQNRLPLIGDNTPLRGTITCRP